MTNSKPPVNNPPYVTTSDIDEPDAKEFNEDGLRVRPNKTVLKQELLKLQAAILELASLAKAKRDALPLDADARHQLEKIAAMKADAARARELRFASKNFTAFEINNIESMLAVDKLAAQKYVHIEHQAEKWRDKLLSNAQSVTELVADYPNANSQQVRQLVRQATKEAEHNKSPAAVRKLYKLLRELIQESE